MRRVKTDKERRSLFYKMRTRRFAFPLKGDGGRARRNRGTLAGVGTGLVSTGALMVAAGLIAAPVLAIGGGVGLIGYSLFKSFRKPDGSQTNSASPVGKS